MRMPLTKKYDSQSNTGKIPLRNILKKFEIDELLSKQKLGFSVNTETLWKNFGFSMSKEFLIDAKIVQDGWIKKEWIQTNLNKKDLDIRHINKLLGLLAFEIWYRLFVSKNLSDSEKLSIA